MNKIKKAIIITYRILITLPRDLNAFLFKLKLERQFKNWNSNSITVAKNFTNVVKKHPNKACLLYNETKWTFKDVEDYSNRIANSFHKKYSLKKGDIISLFMENRPEFVCIWLGLSRIGVVTALINTNLRKDSLKHSIEVAKSKAIIYTTELRDAIEEVRPSITGKNLVYIKFNNNTDDDNDETTSSLYKNNVENFDSIIKSASTELFTCNEVLNMHDPLVYIYTSGTTGLPKPSVIKNFRYFSGSWVFFNAAKLTSDDVVYVPLPIYHGNGGLIGVGCAIVCGGTVVIKKRFSALSFWKDCIDYKCTAFIYVGEICRYLLQQPISPIDQAHSVRIAIGNGLRENIWLEFSNRFGVKALEFYGSTEGNVNFVNFDCKIGSCGFLPIINNYIRISPTFIIKVNNDYSEYRDENTKFCVQSEPNEKGVAIGLIGDKPLNTFSGYSNDKEATKAKIIENVFKNGQNAFNTGDLFRIDEYGYLYFCDRLGDTFRWKGENVSTTEVENIISSKFNSVEVVVYGIEVPHVEGRAGMATINSENIDIQQLSNVVNEFLAPYARPMFVRFAKEIDYTGTFKASKSKLKNEGFNINEIKDQMYYYDLNEKVYKLLTKEMYDLLIDNKLKF